MSKSISFPQAIFSKKEISDFKRRMEVLRRLRVGETWKEIKRKTGAHLQTIAIVSKRLKGTKQRSKAKKTRVRRSPIFLFGQNPE